MNDVLRNYSEIDLRNCFDTHILNKNVSSNPFIRMPASYVIEFNIPT